MKNTEIGPPQFRMVARSGAPEAMDCPFFLCAVCGSPVFTMPDDRKAGYVIWWRHYPGGSGRPEQLGPFVIHQGDCDRELVKRVEAMADPRWTGHGSSNSLVSILGQLVHNTGHPPGTDDGDPEYPREAEYIAPAPTRWRAGHYDRTAR